VSKIEKNGKTSLRRPKLLIKEVKGLMKKKCYILTFNLFLAIIISKDLVRVRMKK